MGTLGINNVAAKTAHVNLMTDTVIANLNAESLRAVIRSMLAGDQEGQLTSTFQKHVQSYLRRDIEIRRPLTPPSFAKATTAAAATAGGSSAPAANDGAAATARPFHKAMEDLNHLRMRILALLGCGLAFEGLGIVAEIVRHSAPLMHRVDLAADEETLLDTLAAVDADMVQCLTAIRSNLVLLHGNRAQLGEAQIRALAELRQSLEECRRQNEAQQTEFVYERGMDMLDGIFAALKR